MSLKSSPRTCLKAKNVSKRPKRKSWKMKSVLKKRQKPLNSRNKLRLKLKSNDSMKKSSVVLPKKCLKVWQLRRPNALSKLTSQPCLLKKFRKKRRKNLLLNRPSKRRSTR